MKKFKSFIKEKHFDDFEEDLLRETHLILVMYERYKAGKAGFTTRAI